MRYDVLRAFDRVHTPPLALARWDATAADAERRSPSPAVPELVSESQNFVYRFRDAARGASRYLRLTHESHRGRDFVQAELDFVDYLARSGADVAAPVRSRDGHLVETIPTEIGEFHAVVFDEVCGQPVKWNTDAENRAILFERGRALGKIHHLSQEYHPPGPQRFHWYHDDLFLSPWTHLPETEPDARREYQQMILFLLARPRTPANYGMIHGDFASYNTFRRPADGRTIAFDFDDCCYHWYALDIAVAIQGAAQLPDKYRLPYLRVLLEGYATEKSLEGDGPAEVGMFCRLSCLYRYLALTRHADSSHLTPQQQSDLAARRAALTNPVSWM
jgi:Ser/Thr protein kinase RdoA (MazF antagonist)